MSLPNWPAGLIHIDTAELFSDAESSYSAIAYERARAGIPGKLIVLAQHKHSIPEVLEFQLVDRREFREGHAV